MPFLHTEVVDDWLVHAIKPGRLTDPLVIDQIGRSITESVRALPVGERVVIDFRAVRQASSALVGMLVSIKREIDARECELVLTRLSPEIRQMLQITRLDTQFQISERLRDVVRRRERASVPKDLLLVAAASPDDVSWIN
jgi:anti-anti-sigma factor